MSGKTIRDHLSWLGHCVDLVWSQSTLTGLVPWILWRPYDANHILKSLGTWYWVCVMIELVIWLIFGSLLIQKFKLNTSNGPAAESA